METEHTYIDEKKQEKILKLHNDVFDIYNMCTDLNNIVKTQSETIDNIIISTDITNQNIEHATEELKSATIYKTKTLHRNIIIGTVVGICIGGPLGCLVGGLKTTVICMFGGFITPIVV